jgi:hypothetical protein
VPDVIKQGDLVAMDNVRQANSFSALCRATYHELALGYHATVGPCPGRRIVKLQWV